MNLALLGLAVGGCPRRAPEAPAAPAIPPEPTGGRSIEALQAAFRAGELEPGAVVRGALARGEALDERLRAVIEWHPDPLSEAPPKGSLFGVPILVKDNLDTADMDTTAGSLALLDRRPERDAAAVRRLKAAGAVIVGKANMSEWANIRSTRSQSGWSARGGQCLSPFGEGRCPCGSSSGSAVAVAAGYVPAAIGTETDGSIHCPASQNGVVGIKPTVGLVSGEGVIPISSTQDAVGPIARSVADAARVLAVLAEGPHAAPYGEALDPAALAGARLGIARGVSRSGFHPGAERLFARAVADLERAGATVEERDLSWAAALSGPELALLLMELRHDLGRYLEARGAEVKSLADVVAFNRAHPEGEALERFGQDLLLRALDAAPLGSEAYRAARAASTERARSGLSAALAGLDALVAPTTGPAWVLDPVYGDHFSGGSSTTPAAVAGFPSLTVPMGRVGGLPVGLSFIGAAWSEARLIGLGHAYELTRSAPTPPFVARG